MGDLEERPPTEVEEGKAADIFIKVKKFVGGIKYDGIKEILFSAAAAKIAAALIICTIISVESINNYNDYYKDKNPGYAVKFKGQFLGYVKDKDAASKALKDLKDEIKGYDPSISINDELEFEKIVVSKDKLTDEKSMVQYLKPNFYVQYTSYAISINDNEIGILASEDEAKQVVEEMKKYYQEQEAKSGAQVLNLAIKDNIKIYEKVVSAAKIVNAKTLINTLIAGRGVTKKYEVKDGDSLWRIASNNNLNIDDIIAINSAINPERLQIGQQINLSVSEPYLNVETTIKAVFDEDIPYETKYIDDGKLYRGQTRVVESGEYGITKVEKQITKLNGKELVSSILSTAVAKTPVTRILARGTKELIGSGRFLWPVNGFISSGFGSRGWEYHEGLDIAAPNGTPIAAADSGTVTLAQRYYGYGKLVIIDHGNGYSTYYGHCSTILVDEGQTVTKGQHIANVGSTGNSTGPHVHFEIRLNGSAQNPLRYLQ